MTHRVRIETSIEAIDRGQWDGLEHGDSPFSKWGFLAALEKSGSIGGDSGWLPHYVCVENDGVLVGAVAAFLKFHSYGEYIFDWGWADASQRMGVSYYPKLVMMAPVSSVTGRRLLVSKGASGEVSDALISAVDALADELKVSSIHWLFVSQEEQEKLSGGKYAPRSSLQFHWFNNEYKTFDDFLGSLRSSKRKQLKKERRRAAEVAQFRFKNGQEVSAHELDRMDEFYRRTVAYRGGHPYLEEGFFHELAKEMPEALLIGQAVREDEVLAGALFLESHSALFGRYWGCAEYAEFMHFECAYYQGIERAIEKGFCRFEAGAQGEHKLLRGFEPITIRSCHWVREPRLWGGVQEFLLREAFEHSRRVEQLRGYLPYKRNTE